MNFEQIERKIMRPPAAHNVARLLDPSCETKTTQNVAKFALGIPSFNYAPAIKMCVDRVSLGLSLSTALNAVEKKGAPAGRKHNASLVRAFWEYDEHRHYSSGKVIENYDGHYRISRDILVPTSPTFTILEKSRQVPVVLCGWKDVALQRDQIRAWLTMLESGLFSFADYRHSPWEVLLLPEGEFEGEFKRMPRVISRGEYELFSERDMRELATMYARAQIAAMPIARELWEKREQRRHEQARSQAGLERGEPTDPMPDLFATDPDRK